MKNNFEEGEEKQGNKEEIGGEDGSSSSREAEDENGSREWAERVERGEDAPPILLERGSHSATTCKKQKHRKNCETALFKV